MISKDSCQSTHKAYEAINGLENSDLESPFYDLVLTVVRISDYLLKYFRKEVTAKHQETETAYGKERFGESYRHSWEFAPGKYFKGRFLTNFPTD